MAKVSPETKLNINVSLDHYMPDRNDELRGLDGYYYHAVATIKELRSIQAHNLTIGVHTVISNYNAAEMPQIARVLSELVGPENYITEIAEQRNELRTMGLDITPHVEQYKEAIKGIGASAKGVRQAFRREYYKRVIDYLYHDGKAPPCYAGYASCQITPDAQVWQCCIRARNLGNLREHKYDLREIWNSPVMKHEREITRGCSCPMANASYTNMLLHYPSLIKVLGGLI